MAKKKVKKAPTKITKEQIRKMDKAAIRKSMIDAGQQLFPVNKVHKSKKSYTRKPKHKKKIDL